MPFGVWAEHRQHQLPPRVHWHVIAMDENGRRRGALTLTEAAAKAEAAIEEAEKGRQTDIEQCSQPCYGKRL